MLFGFLVRDLHALDRVQRRHGRQHARLLPALRRLSEQRHRRRLAGIAAGAALHKKLQREDGIAVAFAGDGVDRLRAGPRGDELRRHGAVRPAVAGALQGRAAGPLLLHQQLLRHGRPDPRRDHGLGPPGADRRGREPANLHAETVDGANPLPSPTRSPGSARSSSTGKGPALLDVETYRISGHSTTDANVYRTREEMQAWSPPIPSRPTQQACAAGLLDATCRRARRRCGPRSKETIRAVTAAAVNPEAAPPIDIAARPTLIGGLMYSHGSRDLNGADLALAEAAAASLPSPPARQEEPHRAWAGRGEALADAGDHLPRRALRGDPPPLPA